MHTVFATHSVDNQPPPFGTHNLWDDDAALREAVCREGGEAFSSRLAEYGALAASLATEVARLQEERRSLESASDLLRQLSEQLREVATALKALETENGKLKRLLAERDLEIDLMRQVNRKKW